MKILIAVLLFIALTDQRMAVTPEYTDYLKKHVSWEVVDYEENIFKGWTYDEVKTLLGDVDGPSFEGGRKVKPEPIPTSINWQGADCIHAIRDQGMCGSCWAFATVGMVSDRCCLQKEDKGWLAPGELVNCDKATGNQGCHGGMTAWALKYVEKFGLVDENCYPYQAADTPCPMQCKNGKKWDEAHVCKPKAIVDCGEFENMVTCLKTGPISVRMIVYEDFLYYKSGIYCWDHKCSDPGGHVIRCVGHKMEPEPHFICANSWTENWGEKGYFRISSKDGCGLRLTPHDTWAVDY